MNSLFVTLFSNELSELISLHAVLLFNAYDSIQYQSFVHTQFNDFTYSSLNLMILLYIDHLFVHIV